MNEHIDLITGGAGFIGSNLCRRLLSQDRSVICLDNYSSGQRDNIADLVDNPRFSCIEADVADSDALSHIENVETIFNLACPASPPFYQANPIGTLKTCVLGAINVLELARRTSARVLQASTSEVYGDPLEHPQRESYRGNVNPIGIRACYDEGKRAAEALFFDYWRTYGVDIRVVRIFNTYGPGMRPDDGRVVSNFIMEALKGADLTVYGDGTQTRSFCYVDDMIDGLLAMMACPDFTGPVNLGNPEEYSMVELANLIVALTGSNSSIVHLDLPEDDPTCRRPDISLAGDRLGWKPTTHVADGLAKTIEYFKGRMS